uniref:Putative ras-related protein rap-2b n=1 Tax=Lutzomyia longipalpis TaxID=7200 RepID=A0A1B0CU23_LUTLO
MPGPCQRLRLPSLVTVMRSPKAECSPIRRKEHHRVVMMGAARVGKSSIISQFLYDKYLARYRQTVEELHRGEYELPDGAALTLDILDTSGAYQFPAMRALSISTGGAFILVFSVDEEESWKEVERLREQIIEARGFRVPIVIVANKADLKERKLPRELTETIATVDWEVWVPSAKDNTGIVDVFKELLAQAKIRYNLSPAVRRRRQSLPSYATQHNGKVSTTPKHSLKRHSCTVA